MFATGKLQHVGRSGVAGGTRYTAHESGLVAEELTDQVVTGLSTADHNPHRPSSSGELTLSVWGLTLDVRMIPILTEFKIADS